ncbi:universal stress protein [Aquibaculum sediminis]|uniref:universal stress protein n=1 Tax=Aquibaculum sediminis TaxID=3231907 RepID=UPI0034544FD0
MSKIIACIDGSVYTASVCDYAAWVAPALETEVELLHVLGRRQVTSVPANLSGNLSVNDQDSLLHELAEHDERHAKLAQQRGRLILDEAKARLAKAGIERVTPRLRHGDLLDSLREIEADAAVVIIGKRGEAADFAKLHLGSNLERVARASTRPLLVAARAFRQPTRLLIAYDDGPSARKAVAHVAKSRLLKDLSCRLLMVGADQSNMRERLEDAAGQLRGAGYAVDADILPGAPDEVIAREVERDGIDLLVIGAYGHSRIRRLMIGSTTSAMVRSCKVPVLMFR